MATEVNSLHGLCNIAYLHGLLSFPRSPFPFLDSAYLAVLSWSPSIFLCVCVAVHCIYEMTHLQPPPLSPEVLVSASAGAPPAGAADAEAAWGFATFLPGPINLTSPLNVSSTFFFVSAEVSMNMMSPILSDLLLPLLSLLLTL